MGSSGLILGFLVLAMVVISYFILEPTLTYWASIGQNWLAVMTQIFMILVGAASFGILINSSKDGRK